VVAQQAAHIERRHAVGAHVAEGHWRPGLGSWSCAQWRSGYHGRFPRKLPPSMTWFGGGNCDPKPPSGGASRRWWEQFSCYRFATYCLSKTATSSYSRPFASVPFAVAVSVLPSWDTTTVPVQTSFPAFVRL
jgi:hypothetical protein